MKVYEGHVITIFELMINLFSHLLLHFIDIISFVEACKLPSNFFKSFQVGIRLISEWVFVHSSQSSNNADLMTKIELVIEALILNISETKSRLLKIMCNSKNYMVIQLHISPSTE